MSPPILYHVPPSFYSQIARLVLCELEVPFETKVVGPGPPTFETYAPWYMKLNPMGTVPTLVDGDQPIADSDKIMRYAVANLSSMNLTPDNKEEAATMESWIGHLRDIPIRELSYGAEKSQKMGYRVNQFRIRNLEKRKLKNPEMGDVYDNKKEDMRQFAERAITPETVSAHQARVNQLLDEMNALFGTQPWLTGSSYSLADTVWTVGVARFFMLELDPLNNRPNLSEWYQRVKARPSFKAANVWESFDVTAMLGVLLKKFGPKLLVGSLAITAIVVGIKFFFSS